MKSCDLFSTLYTRRPDASDIERWAVDYCGGMDAYRECRDANDLGYIDTPQACRFRVAFQRALRIRGENPAEFLL